MATRRTTPAVKVIHLLCFVAAAAGQALSPLVYKGCYTSAGQMTDFGSYQFQTPGYCQNQCVKAGKAVMGTINGSDCYCGDLLPSPDDKTSDSSCSVKCNGYGQMTCGGSSTWSVQLTGLNNNVGSVQGSSSGSSSNSNSNSSPSPSPTPSPTPSPSPSPSPSSNSDSDSDNSSSDDASSAAAATSSVGKSSPTKVAEPSVVTHASTIIVTAPGQTQAQTAVVTTTEAPSKGGANVAGIAAGVVVGVVAVTAAAGVAFFFLRSRKRRAIEEQHRNSLGPSWYGQKPNSSSSNSISDSRLEPSVMLQRRHSDVSIADNQDYSRRILKVMNPDGS